MKLISNILLLIFLCKSYLIAQIDFNFLKHLSNSNLQSEHYHYLISECKSKDTMNYLLAKYFLQYKNDSLFFSHYEQSKSISSNDSLLTNAASIYFFKQPKSQSIKWMNILKNDVPENLPQSKFVLLVSDPHVKSINYGNEIFKNDFINYKNSLLKKPVLSAFFSAVIPGLGKAYINQYRSFAVTLISHMLYGLQLNESIKKFGIKHPLTIANLTLFSVFYSANIYGSYVATKKMKTEKLQQLLYDASDNFYVNFGNSLYP
jgi:hypothetical protein